MVRRSFRMGLRLGLLIGIGFALFKTMQSRRGSTTVAPEPGAWEPMQADAPEQPRTAPARPAATPARPAAPPRPAAEPLRMPDVPAVTPPSAASEARAATSSPSTPPPAAVDEVGEPIMEPAPPVDPPPARPRRPRAPKAPSPPEPTLLGADDAPAHDPALDIVDDIVPANPVKKAAAKKAAAPVKKGTAPPAAPAKKAAKAAKKAAKSPARTKKAAPVPGWVEALDGTCPPTHPVKAKVASKLFHLPGMFAYVRTRPDRCYLDADTAVADGFTAAKR